MPLANYLKMLKRQEVLALLALKWSFRRIERETGVRRETISAYARGADSNPAKTFPGSGTVPESDCRALVCWRRPETAEYRRPVGGGCEGRARRIMSWL